MSATKKILIVDDEADQREYLATVLEDNGYAIVTAEDGVRGFELARAGGVDLITLDISMDNESGIKMFRNLQGDEATKSIPVIMITGVSGELKGFIERSKRLTPPQAFFEKPVDRDTLLDTVKSLVS
ncbi:MAG: response regulator [Candidatus Zixiibacteriota bacterium]